MLIAGTARAQIARQLVYDVAQFSTNANLACDHDQKDHLTDIAKLKHLLEYNTSTPNTCYFRQKNGQAITVSVKLQTPLHVSAGGKLEVYTRRHNNGGWADYNPMEFDVEVSASDNPGENDWTNIGTAIYRSVAMGVGERAEIPVTADREVRNIRLTLKRTNGNKTDMAVSGIQLYYTSVKTCVGLITDAGMLSSNATMDPGDGQGSELKRLLEDNDATWFSANDPSKGIGQPHYIQVDLGENKRHFGEDEAMVVYVRRHSRNAYHGSCQVTAMQIEVSENGTDWKDFHTMPDGTDIDTYAYFLDRGNNTEEFSLPLTSDKTFRYIRFTITANNSNTYYKGDNDTPIYYTGLRRFQIYRMKKGGDFPSLASGRKMADRFRLADDYDDTYKDYTFEHTRGIFDYVKDPNSVYRNYCSDAMFRDGVWLDNQDVKNLGIEVPDFNMLDSTSDASIESGQRQNTHVVHHYLYAIPGDAIALYPFYDFYKQEHYEENFSHWYDYANDGRLKIHADRAVAGDDPTSSEFEQEDALDFIINPGSVCRTDKAGFFGGKDLPRQVDDGWFDIYNRMDLLQFAARVNGGERNLKGRLMADIDMSGVTDFSMIGNYVSRFCGVFDGQGHTISNLRIDDGNDRTGLFGWVESCVIQDFTLDESCYISGGSHVGVIGRVQNDNAPEQGPIVIKGIVNKGTVRSFNSSQGYAGGIIGYVSCNKTNSSALTISDCAFTGTIRSHRDAGLLIGWLDFNSGTSECVVSNCWSSGKGVRIESGNSDTEITGQTGLGFADKDGNYKEKQWLIRRADYKLDANGNVLAYTLPIKETNNHYESNPDTEGFANKMGDGWQMADGKLASVLHEDAINARVPGFAPNREYGTVAMFLAPRNPYAADGKPRKLKEYTIAGDFSLSFKVSAHLDRDKKIIKEPVIHFRHLFHIQDGVEFAEEFSGSVEKNRQYVQEHRRYVSAKAKAPFQVRLESPIPKYDAQRPVYSKWYYKISDQFYKRVVSADIRIYNADTGEEIDAGITDPEKKMFHFAAGGDEMFSGYGSREIDGVTYNMCGGGGKYYRHIQCDAEKAVPGRYLIRLIAKNFNNEIIKVCGETGTQLILKELMVTILPEPAALFDTETNFKKKNPDYSDAKLEEKYGKPQAYVNFDEYAGLENLDEATKKDYLITVTKTENGKSSDRHMYKWPLNWDMSNYAFSYYVVGTDYNFYRVMDHSDFATYKSAIDAAKDNNRLPDGMYDRLYYDTNGEKRGYMYYVNAASDPGIMARLKIDDLCSGSTLHVTGWVCEFSNAGEKANLSFNFVAVMKDGTRRELHTYTTGYVSTAAEWYRLYFSFVPNFSELNIQTEMIDHYELELDNNCKSSNGADFVVDDIRVYLTRPAVTVRQTKPMCDESDGVYARVETPFNVLLQTVGETRATDESRAGNINLYYTFLDSDIYNDEIGDLEAEIAKIQQYLDDGKDADGNPYNKEKYNEDYRKLAPQYEKAFKDAQRTGCYGDGAESTFGKVKVSTYYDGNKAENAADATVGETLRMSIEGEDYIVFDVNPSFEGLYPGKEYIVLLYSESGDRVISPTYDDFDPAGKCAKRCDFRVQGATAIRVDGIVVDDVSGITACENQQPVVQLDIMGRREVRDGDGNLLRVGEVEPIDHNGYFDWYCGTGKEYADETVKDKDGNVVMVHDGNGEVPLTLAEAMVKFRMEYPDSPIAKVETNDVFTPAMRDYILQLSTGENPKLQLHVSSYVFPAVKMAEGEDETYVYVTAIPINFAKDDYLFCTLPTEIRVHVMRHAPSLLHGIAQITYPEQMEDVPLRISLRQLHGVQTDKGNMQGHSVELNIPIRALSTTHGGDGSMHIMTDEEHGSEVFLAATNDPAYKDLWDKSQWDPDEQDQGFGDGLMSVGLLKELQAVKPESDAAYNHFSVVFDNSFRFREGYYYTFVFGYRESARTTAAAPAAPAAPESAPYGLEELACDGRRSFTIKVVAEYAKWTGANGTLNWNDDYNWQRVTPEELMRGQDNDDEYVIVAGGSNENIYSYAPLDFTKVIIPGDTRTEEDIEDGVPAPTFPYMYRPVESETMTLSYLPDYSGDTDADLKKVTRTFTWPRNPEMDADGSNVGSTVNGKDLVFGDVTFGIQYDMAAISDLQKNGDAVDIRAVNCRPWYDHTCEQIHFMPQSRIFNQQFMHYGKAWVDMEVDPARWLTVASPLQGTVAGDMYLPTATARQETELFVPITFDNTLAVNNRFNPAVYQRSWNKSGAANVYQIEGRELPGTGNPWNVAVMANWSNVYNDVAEPYAAGAGFSIKADVRRPVSDGNDAGKVLFRLPKADTEYLYFTQEGDHSGNPTAIDRSGSHRLNAVSADGADVEFTVLGGQPGKFFLVGNPFMTHMDMWKFLDKNSALLQPKYWILTGDNQLAAISDGLQMIDVNGNDATSVAPMQGFFVEAKAPATSLTLKYNAGMMRNDVGFEGEDGVPLKAAGRTASPGFITVTAVSGGEERSRALVRVREDAAAGYDAAEDMVLFSDSETPLRGAVYTVAGNTAAVVNTVPDLEGVEISFIPGQEDEPVTLRFDNTSEAAGYFLYDTSSETYTPVEDGMEYEVSANPYARYYLTRGKSSDLLTGIRIANEGRIVRVTTPREGLDVRVCDTLGRVVNELHADGQVMELELPQGIHVVEASDGTERVSVKFVM